MSTNKTGIDYSKAFTYLLGITLGIFAWFGKVSYDKLNSIEEKLEVLLVENGVQKTEIKNLKERFDKMQPCSPENKRNNKTIVSHDYEKEAVLPKSMDDDEDKLFVLK
jgi:hypothetical protein